MMRPRHARDDEMFDGLRSGARACVWPWTRQLGGEDAQASRRGRVGRSAATRPAPPGRQPRDDERWKPELSMRSLVLLVGGRRDGKGDLYRCEARVAEAAHDLHLASPAASITAGSRPSCRDSLGGQDLDHDRQGAARQATNGRARHVRPSPPRPTLLQQLAAGRFSVVEMPQSRHIPGRARALRERIALGHSALLEGSNQIHPWEVRPSLYDRGHAGADDDQSSSRGRSRSRPPAAGSSRAPWPRAIRCARSSQIVAHRDAQRRCRDPVSCVRDAQQAAASEGSRSGLVRSRRYRDDAILVTQAGRSPIASRR